jgi:hypothetical protein
MKIFTLLFDGKLNSSSPVCLIRRQSICGTRKGMSPFVFERVGKSWNDLVVGHNNKQYSKGLNDIFKIICIFLKIPMPSGGTMTA